MATLARLNQETERLKAQNARKIFVSTSPVQAFRVTDQRKELLSKDAPLIFAIPDDGLTGSSSFMIDGSVGSSLRWTLTGINHILRTVSKWGEPTYLFADILDNDPKAFVAVTMNKDTSPDELFHLESILSRVSQFHVAEKKPAQLPNPDQVMSTIGKGIKALMGLGGNKQQQRQSQQQVDEQQQPAYLPVKDLVKDGAGRPVPADYAAGGGRPSASDVPWPLGSHHTTARFQGDAGSRDEGLPQAGGSSSSSSSTAMGVKSRAEAEDRLAQLKAELAKEGAPPTAPNVSATPAETAQYMRQQQQQQRQQGLYGSSDTSSSGNAYASSDWHIYQPYRQVVTDTRPYHGTSTGDQSPSTSSARSPQASGAHGPRGDAPAGPDSQAGNTTPGISHPRHPYYPTIPGAYSSASPVGGSGGAYQQRSAAYDTAGPAAAAAGGGKLASVKPGWGQSGAVDAANANDLQQEAEAARTEWIRAQREADERADRLAAQRRDRDGGWGRSGDVITAGGQPMAKHSQEAARENKAGQQSEGPDWMELLGKVFGGSAYSYAAPDL